MGNEPLTLLAPGERTRLNVGLEIPEDAPAGALVRASIKWRPLAFSPGDAPPDAGGVHLTVATFHLVRLTTAEAVASVTNVRRFTAAHICDDAPPQMTQLMAPIDGPLEKGERLELWAEFGGGDGVLKVNVCGVGFDWQPALTLESGAIAWPDLGAVEPAVELAL